MPKPLFANKTRFAENKYIENGKWWSVARLQEAVKNEEVFDLPIAGIDTKLKPWDLETFFDFCCHAHRARRVKLDMPIILSPYGQVMDGFHRIAKAIITGKPTIKAVRMREMIDPDGVYSE